MLEHLVTTILRRAIQADDVSLPDGFVPELWRLRLTENINARRDGRAAEDSL